jgi:hypothetical protein
MLELSVLAEKDCVVGCDELATLRQNIESLLTSEVVAPVDTRLN